LIKNFKLKIKNSVSGFTLVELAVVIVIIAILSATIILSVQQYIKRGKDANLLGNMATLPPAGEVFYNASNSYDGFCNPADNSALKNTISQLPVNSSNDTFCYNSNSDPDSWTGESNPAGLCCLGSSDAWAAYAQSFSDFSKLFCVDSRGVKKEVDVVNMHDIIYECP